MRSAVRVVAVAAALALAACGGGRGGDVAATVNGVDIPVTLLAAVVAARTGPDPGPSEYAAAADAQPTALSQLIQSEVIDQAADAEGVRVPEKRIDRAIEDIAEGAGGMDKLEEELAGSGLTMQDLRDQQATQLRVELLREQLADEVEVSDKDVEAEYRARLDTNYRFVEMSLILVATKAEANEVIALLEDGADFAELARERSLDQTSAAAGGSTEQPRGFLPPAIEDEVWSAQRGTLIGPRRLAGPEGQTAGAPFLIVRVDGFRTVQLAEVRDDLREELETQQSNVALEEFFAETFDAADIWVDPRFGTWDAEQAIVVGPEGAAPPPVPPSGAPPPPTAPVPAPSG